MSLTPAMRSGGRQGGSTPTARLMTSADPQQAAVSLSAPEAPKGPRGQPEGMGPPPFLGICLLTFMGTMILLVAWSNTLIQGAVGPRGCCWRQRCLSGPGWGKRSPLTGHFHPRPSHVSPG